MKNTVYSVVNSLQDLLNIHLNLLAITEDLMKYLSVGPLF